ncbi:MAG TPA: tetratricopeptide repeat protein [Kamptonema sp.]|nr:tetratricopeptide repeat protein [Kamptonema sp.]
MNWVNLMQGTILGSRYNIISHLGGGGFAQTYLAEDRQLPGNHRCVVKQLKPQATDPVTLQIARRLFDTEAQVLYKLGNHDRIPQLFAYFEENQEFYLVQEFIEGQNLSEELAQGKLSEDRVIALLQGILEILDFVHQQNAIHRDVNPHNIIRRQEDGKLVLIDFGAVKQITTQMLNPQAKNSLSVSIGTPGYMPSEQAHGNPKLSSDIYAVGIIGIQALTSEVPHQLPKDPDTEEIIWQEKVSVSPELAKVLDTMVRYDFRQRYMNAGVALQAIKELTSPLGVTAPLILPVSAPAKPRQKGGALYLKSGLIIGIIGLGVAASVYIVNAFNSANATQLHSRGNTLYNLNRYEEALAAYNQAINIRADDAAVWKDKAKALYELKKYSESRAACDKAIQLNPDYLEAWTARGYALDKLQQDREAIASFEKALEIQPNYPEAWKGRGDALLNLQRYEDAIASYEKALKFQPNFYEAWYSQGLAYQNLKEYQPAFEAYQKAVELKSDNSQAWYNLGNVQLELNKNEAAVAAYEKAVRFQPSYYQAWYSKGIALLKLTEYEEAVVAYKQAVKLKADYYQAWYNLGWSLHQLRRYEDAIDAYNKVLDLQPREYQAWYNRGNALYNLKRYEEAIASYNEAVYVKPDHYEAWYSRGNALLELKRYQDAIASYERAVRYKPDYSAAIAAKKQAETLLGLDRSHQGEKEE